eukprot:TRINITY_DN2942_c0_g1_i5.p1 TRINITY_DN2942_c0_g1~~TRINITY_DN2942_c0_g1_i5.p1  ORF type:complete len:274 (-),score=31.66 TRINITY_DN2942_c0_g1_i5:41-862(-)
MCIRDRKYYQEYFCLALVLCIIATNAQNTATFDSIQSLVDRTIPSQIQSLVQSPIVIDDIKTQIGDNYLEITQISVQKCQYQQDSKITHEVDQDHTLKVNGGSYICQLAFAYNYTETLRFKRKKVTEGNGTAQVPIQNMYTSHQLSVKDGTVYQKVSASVSVSGQIDNLNITKGEDDLKAILTGQLTTPLSTQLSSTFTGILQSELERIGNAFYASQQKRLQYQYKEEVITFDFSVVSVLLKQKGVVQGLKGTINGAEPQTCLLYTSPSPRDS